MLRPFRKPVKVSYDCLHGLVNPLCYGLKVLYLDAYLVDSLRQLRLGHPSHRLHVLYNLLNLCVRLLYTFRLVNIALPFDFFA